MTHNPLLFDYTFSFENGRILHFPILLDPVDLRLLNVELEIEAEWARLENHQCSNCTLTAKTHPQCPIAKNLVNILSEFKDVFSYEQVEVIVKANERTYSKICGVQKGLGAMLGIFMVSSGCPIMSKLKPMVRFHLPFANVQETISRSVGSYLLSQYFNHKAGKKADWNLDGLKQSYKEIQTVNYAMANRLRSISAKDANVNALIILDIFAKEIPETIDSSLNQLKYLYQED
ncbi:MAG: hypothetical protein JW956_07515 [Calditrichaceae bacterium]|nr:hypothetical protein [Calditrichaceae bacterium]